MGNGGIVCKSTKQKLNTKSSTEAELVGTTDYIPNTIWSKHFLEAQGHKITTNIGRASSGKLFCHIDIRYFFLKDRIISDGITVRHCPTEQMLADFFTKPLQGQLFLKFRDVLLGYKHVSELQKIYDATPSPEERVGHKVLDAEVPPQQSENVNTGTGTMYTGTGTLYTGTDQDDFGTWSLSL
jgi:hypothetical protein